MVDDLKSKRQQISSLLLRLGLHYPGKKTWGKAHRNWLASIKLGQREQRFVFEEPRTDIRTCGVDPRIRACQPTSPAPPPLLHDPS